MHDTPTFSSTADIGSAHMPVAELTFPALRGRVDERARLEAWQEQECIDARGRVATVLGATQQDCERLLVLLLNAHPRYLQWCRQLANQERAVETIQAGIEAACDVRRESEGERLDRYIQALVDVGGTSLMPHAIAGGVQTSTQL